MIKIYMISDYLIVSIEWMKKNHYLVDKSLFNGRLYFYSHNTALQSMK